MDSARRAAIKARCEAATPGPWPAYARDGSEVLADEERWHLGFDVEGPPEPDRGRFERSADALFVSHARQDVPDLLAALEAAEQRAETLAAALRRVLGNIATGYPLHNGYSVYYDGHFPDDLIALARAALGDAAPTGEGATDGE